MFQVLCCVIVTESPTLAAHLGGIFAAALIVQIRYFFQGENLAYHVEVMASFAAWAMCSILCHLLMRRAAKRPAANASSYAAPILRIQQTS